MAVEYHFYARRSKALCWGFLLLLLTVSCLYLGWQMIIREFSWQAGWGNLSLWVVVPLLLLAYVLFSVGWRLVFEAKPVLSIVDGVLCVPCLYGSHCQAVNLPLTGIQSVSLVHRDTNKQGLRLVLGNGEVKSLPAVMRLLSGSDLERLHRIIETHIG